MKSSVCVFMLIILSFFISACSDSENVKNAQKNIKPNPNKVYEDQCYVWLKEMPDFFRERHNLSGGYAWDRHSYQGVYVSDNPASMFYSRHYVGETVVLFKPDKPDGGMSKENIIYQYSLSQGNDGDLDQIWVLGEFMPPNDCKQWVVASTGKWRGVKAEGVWHWFWPEDRNWEKPENPPGYDYPNAEEFNYQYPEENLGEPKMLGPDYWIEDPPYGVTSDEPVLGLPATKKPEKFSRIKEIGYMLVKRIPDLQQRLLIPAGNKNNSEDRPQTTGYDHHNFEGIYFSENNESRFHLKPFTGKVMTIHTPQPGEDMTTKNIYSQFYHIQWGEPEEDQLWLWGEYFPPAEPKFILKVATGEYEGLAAIGTWTYNSSTSFQGNNNFEDYDYMLVTEFTFDLPK